MINLKVIPMTLNQQSISIAGFFCDGKDSSTTDFSKFFNLDEDEILTEKNFAKKVKLVKNGIKNLFEEKLPKIKQKAKDFQAEWNAKSALINTEFEKIFGKLPDMNCVGRVGINYCCPRFLETHLFDLFCDASNSQAIQVAVHEMTHFAWFYVWKKVFPKHAINQYEWPNLDWLISEISVDPIFYYSKLKDLSSEHPTYDIFYMSKINGKPLINYVRKLYKENSLKDYMKKIYAFFKQNPELAKCLIE